MISPQSITRASSRHPWTTVGAWVVAIVTADRGLGLHDAKTGS